MNDCQHPLKSSVMVVETVDRGPARDLESSVYQAPHRAIRVYGLRQDLGTSGVFRLHAKQSF
jgi:hypothetical protein